MEIREERMARCKRWWQKKILRIVGKIEAKGKIMESQRETNATINWQVVTIKQEAWLHHQRNVNWFWKAKSVHKTVGWLPKTIIQKEPNGIIGQCWNQEVTYGGAWQAEEWAGCYYEDGSGSSQEKDLELNDSFKEWKWKAADWFGEEEHSMLKSWGWNEKITRIEQKYWNSQSLKINWVWKKNGHFQSIN